MEGGSEKMSQVYNDGSTSNAETFETRAPPPPYQQQQPVMQQPQQQPQPQQMGQNVQFVQHPGTSVHVVQQPVTMMQPGMQQVIVGPNHTMVGGVSTVLIHPTIGEMPTMVRCHSCQQQIVTRVNYTPTARTHVWAAVLCLIGCWPLVCLPYCMNSCLRAEHHCSNCGTFVGASF